MKLTFVVGLAALFTTISATVTPITTGPSSSQETAAVEEVEYSDERFDELINESRSWLKVQMERALDMKAISTEDFANDQQRHKFESMILQGHYAIPGEKREERPIIDREGIVSNLQAMAQEGASEIPSTLSSLIAKERELASESKNPVFHKTKAHSVLFWETYRKFLNVDRLEEVLDRHDEL